MEKTNNKQGEKKPTTTAGKLATKEGAIPVTFYDFDKKEGRK